MNYIYLNLKKGIQTFVIVLALVIASFQSSDAEKHRAIPYAVDEGIQEVASTEDPPLSIKSKIFNLKDNGAAKSDGTSLTDISWELLGNQASLLQPTSGKNFALLCTNTPDQDAKVMAVIGEKTNAKATRYLALMANPFRDVGSAKNTLSADMQKVMENALAWLTRRDDLKTQPFTVAIAHFWQSNNWPDESKTRDWLDAHYPGQVSYNAATTCNNGSIGGCLDNNPSFPDLLIIGHEKASDATNVANIATAVEQALENGIPVLYMHSDSYHTSLGIALFPKLDITYGGQNSSSLDLKHYNPALPEAPNIANITEVKSLIVGIEIPIVFTNTGGKIESCAVTTGTLPTGLHIDNTTCEIRGVPTQAKSSEEYTITATNAEGSNTATVTIATSISATLFIGGTPAGVGSVYASYQFLPFTNKNDATFSIVNKPSWVTFETSSGLLEGIPEQSDIGNYDNIVISVMHEGITKNFDAFSINVGEAIDLAHKYGLGNTSGGSDWAISDKYRSGDYAVDNDDATANHSSYGGWYNNNYLQIKLPHITVRKIVVQNANESTAWRLQDAKLYFGPSSTIYHKYGYFSIDETQSVATLQPTSDEQSIEFDSSKDGKYVIVKAQNTYQNSNKYYLHLKKVEVYGALRQKPIFDSNTSTELLIKQSTPIGTQVAKFTGTDQQNDPIFFGIEGTNDQFTMHPDGTLRVKSTLDYAKHKHVFDIFLHDRINKTTKRITVTTNTGGEPENIARFGVATSSSLGQKNYMSPNRAIDGDITTISNAPGAGYNWFQLALPKGTKVSSMVFDKALYHLPHNVRAKLYFSTQPYDMNIPAPTHDDVKTLTGSQNPQSFQWDNLQDADYLIVRTDPLHKVNISIAELKIYGVIPSQPFFDEKTTYTIHPTTSVAVKAVDYQDDTISYSLSSSADFTINSQGFISVRSGSVPDTYELTVSASDGIHVGTKQIVLYLTSPTALEDVLASGDVVNSPITEAELIDGVLAEITKKNTPISFDEIVALKKNIFNLNNDGTAKTDGSSLTDIDWALTPKAAFLTRNAENNFPLLFTNDGSPSVTLEKKIVAIVGKKANTTRYLALGSSPFRDVVSADMDQVMENLLAWLTKRDDLKTAPFTVAIAQLWQSNTWPDQTKTREWLDTHYPSKVSYNIATACNNGNIGGCLDNIPSFPDLLIIGQEYGYSHASAIAAAVEQALENGIPVLYIHSDRYHTSLGKALFPPLDIAFDKQNTDLFLKDYNPINDLNLVQQEISLSPSKQAIKTLFTHLKNKDYVFDWSKCSNQHAYPLSNCTGVDGLVAFVRTAETIQARLRKLDTDKIRIFDVDNYRLDKLYILTADKFRQSIRYPVNRADGNVFAKAYYADFAVYNYRSINPAQPDLGSFSRGDFSHITPVTKTVKIPSKIYSSSAGVYALPGQTFKVTRKDNEEITVKIYMNTQRVNSTREFTKYARPKFLSTIPILLKSGESMEITSAYGGPIQLKLSTSGKLVEIEFENVGEHPHWAHWSEADKNSFEAKMTAHDYDWAELATFNFEIHARIKKLAESIEDSRWGTITNLAAAIDKYTTNYPHVIAGFKGEGIDVVPEIHDWATDRGMTLETIDYIKHMNSDWAACATCGGASSGAKDNPYDAYWAFDPIGHGDIHEMGHFLQRKLFAGFPNHAGTNPYPYYTQSRYFENTKKDNDCNGLAFKTFFNLVKSSLGKSQDEIARTLNWHNNTDNNLNNAYVFYLHPMMYAQKLGKIENGWHVLARVHILEREMGRAKANWEARKTAVGFGTYSLAEINSISNNDWLVVAYSYAAQLDFTEYFDMTGIPYSPKARAQIKSFDFDIPPKALFVVNSNGYCYKDEFGSGFDRATIPVDGSVEYPY